MSDFTVIPLGVGDAFSARRYSSCLALKADDTWLLIDCPHPIRKVMREGGEKAGIPFDVSTFDAVVLTHMHADHCSGLEGYAFFCYFVLNKRVRLFAHPKVREGLWERHLQVAMGTMTDENDVERATAFEDYFDHTALNDDETVRFGPFEMEVMRTTHHIPTYGMRIRANGRTLGYSADTGYDQALIDWLSTTDLIIHETNRGIHTPYDKLLALPKSTREKMLAIHYPDDWDPDDDWEIELLRTGRHYTV